MRTILLLLSLLLSVNPAAVAAESAPLHVIVHRQSLEGAPENTWAALKQAVAWGADDTVTLEVDLHATKDGKIVLIHDPFLDPRNDEVIGGSGDRLWEEVNDVDFGSWYDRRFKDERLPLFEDVLEFCKLNQVRLTLDLKENVTPQMVRALLNKHEAERVVYWAWVGGFGQLIGRQWKPVLDGDRELIRREVKQWLGDTVWVDDPRVLLDVLHRDAPSQEVKMPSLTQDYRIEDLNFGALVTQVRTGGDAGRIAAARLRKHFAARAGAALTAILADEHASAEAKTIAARALGRLAAEAASNQAKTALNKAFTTQDAELRAAAAYALGKLKDDRSFARLVEMLRNQQQPDKVRVEAARALGRIGSGQAVQPLIATAKEEREKAGEYLTRFVEKAKGFTKDWHFFRDNSAMYWAMPQVLYGCDWALGEIRGEQALEFLLAQYEAKQLPAKDALMEALFIRVPALNAAARIGGPKALAAAKAQAWNPPDDTYMDYVRLTRNFPPEEVVPVLLEFLGHPKPFPHQKAMYALLRLGQPAVEPLAALLRNHQASPLAREWAAWTLGWMDDARAVPALTSALNDTVPAVRAKAAWAMGKMGVKQSASRLKELTQDTDGTVRDSATEALERLGSPSAVRAGSSAVSDQSKAKFLTRQGHQLFLGGKRFRAVGANGVGLFLGCLGVREYAQGRPWAEEALAEAGRRDIPFLRVLGSGFWPNDMNLYFDDPQTYWKRFDEFVALAKKHNVKLLPTLFWNYPMWPDLMKEPCSKMFEKGSRTRGATEKYLRELVGRYKDEPAILCWEISNEMNLGSDLNMTHWPKSSIAPQMGTPEQRTTADSFTTADLVRFTKEVASLIKEIDPNHLVTTGHALPRFSSRSLREGFP